jgi:L-ascorbate metabolism protein UlaG (beta-lactamase superfamily)
MDDVTRAAGARRERILASPRFRDGAFRNTHPVTAGLAAGTRGALMREFLFGRTARRPTRPLPADDPRPRWQRPVERGLRATWLGHSTVLLELDGVRVLTDPVWSDRISPFGPLGPRRFQPVPVPLVGLPPLDAIVISHDHFDHLDHATILGLAPLGVPFVTSLGVGAHLVAWGVPPTQIVELDWWETATLRGGELTITAAPAQHFSGRVGARDRTLWSSMVIASARHKVFFSGDTGLTPEYEAIGARLGPFDLVMLEVGAYHPAWGHVHLGPANALEALRRLGGGRLLPVHWGTFNLALHAWDEPAETLVELATRGGVDLVMPRLGAPTEPARGEAIEP